MDIIEREEYSETFKYTSRRYFVDVTGGSKEIKRKIVNVIKINFLLIIFLDRFYNNVKEKNSIDVLV